MKQYQPLEIGLIDEGRFVGQANGDLLEMQEKLVAFVRLHEDEDKEDEADEFSDDLDGDLDEEEVPA